MKRKWLILPIFILVLVFTLLPASFISASSNLVLNGDFSDGSSDWFFTDNSNGTVDFHDGIAEVISYDEPDANLWQEDIYTSCKSVMLCFDVQRTEEGIDEDSYIQAGFEVHDGGTYLGNAWYDYHTASENFPVGTWYRNNCLSLSQLWEDTHAGSPLPDFDHLEIGFTVDYGGIAEFDNVRLYCAGKGGTAEEQVPVWIRNVDMTCYQVWMNTDNAFEFVFWWEYADNNWVKIYDMSGNEVFSIDMPYGDAHFAADLPDGMYTVKTFHNDMSTPLQEFVIGKP